MGCHFLPPGNFPGPGFESTSLKAYNQFYDDLFSKKINLHLQIQLLGIRASVLPWNNIQGLGFPAALPHADPIF